MEQEPGRKAKLRKFLMLDGGPAFPTNVTSRLHESPTTRTLLRCALGCR